MFSEFARSKFERCGMSEYYPPSPQRRVFPTLSSFVTEVRNFMLGKRLSPACAAALSLSLIGPSSLFPFSSAVAKEIPTTRRSIAGQDQESVKARARVAFEEGRTALGRFELYRALGPL